MVESQHGSTQGLDPKGAWEVADAVLALYESLKRRTRSKLKDNSLRRECIAVQDTLTNTQSIAEATAKGLASTLLKLFRLRAVCQALAGSCSPHVVVNSSVADECEELFSMEVAASEARIYALYTVALLHVKKCATIETLPAVGGGSRTPDFVVKAIGYGECKDLRRTTSDGVWKNLWTQLESADEQLEAAHKRQPLPLLLTCIDLPLEACQDQDELLKDGMRELWPSLPHLPNTQMVVFTCQREEHDNDGDSVSFPYHWRGIENPHAAALNIKAKAFLRCVFQSGWYIATEQAGGYQNAL